MLVIAFKKEKNPTQFSNKFLNPEASYSLFSSPTINIC